ncbi:uncharacterized protein METZ01_LOCUS176065, partial [marine metagenome]
VNNKVKLNNISYLGIYYKRTENPCVAGSIPARATDANFVGDEVHKLREFKSSALLK